MGVFVEEALTPGLQEAEQATYADTQVVAGQAVVNAPARDVQPTTGITSVTDAGVMDVDVDNIAQETTSEGHGGVKRKAGEDAEPASKKLRMGMFTISYVLVADTAIACRICHCSFEKVYSTNTSFTLSL